MRILSIIFLLPFLMACNKQAQNEGIYIPEGLDRRDETRFQQYAIQGKLLYIQHCANCHQNEGQGLAKLYPPLAKSDYLMSDVKRAACIIKNGQKDSIQVNGQTYNMAMPAVSNLSALEIAEILTYITNSWGNENELVSVREVETYLISCGLEESSF